MTSIKDLESRVIQLEDIYNNTFFEGTITKINKIDFNITEQSPNADDIGTDYADVEVYIPRLGTTQIIRNAILVDSRISRLGLYQASITEFDYHEPTISGLLRREDTKGTNVLVICPYGNFYREVYIVGRFSL